MYGSAKSLCVAEFTVACQQLVVLVCPSMPELLRLESELEFFLGDSLEVQSFVELETLPYDSISPHPDIISQRIRALHGLANRKTASC